MLNCGFYFESFQVFQVVGEMNLLDTMGWSNLFDLLDILELILELIAALVGTHRSLAMSTLFCALRWGLTAQKRLLARIWLFASEFN